MRRQSSHRVVKACLNRVARAMHPHTPAGRRLLANSLLVLGYHTVVREESDPVDPCFTPEKQFLREMRRLQSLGYRFLPLLDAVGRLRDRTLGRPTACLTFDDGLCGVYHWALPILRELQIPATVFLVTGLIDSSDTLWHCRLLEALARTRSNTLTWGGLEYDLSSRAARTASSLDLQDLLKAHDDSTLAFDLGQILVGLDVPAMQPLPEGSPFRLLTGAQIAEMSGSGLIDFGAHTARHTILARTPRENARREIARSVAAVAALTGAPCRSFSYPNGLPGDFDRGTMQLVQDVGVEVALTMCTGWNRPGTHPLALRRVMAGDPTDENDFGWRINPLRILLKSRRCPR